ncbi:MAG: thrombospondin type 3 repeat-containing protein [Thermoleophilaceae bacterium]|nr:thrombospondin type 3 repeat-containing protein [Thermoleophilaceae bacterium]
MRIRSYFAVLALAVCVGMAFWTPPASAAPYSDAFLGAGAIDIAGTRGTTSLDLDGAGREAGEPTVPGSNTDHTVWWRYVPAASGSAKFSTCRPTGMNPVPGLSLGLYTGSQVNLLTSVAQGTGNCPAGYDNAQIGPVAVTAGTYYWLQIGGASSITAGDTDLTLTLDFNAAAPANDNWASAMNITGSLPQSIAANNGLATVEAGEPNSDDSFARSSLWYSWTSTFDGSISVNTCGSAVESAMDSVIQLYTGTTPATAAEMSYLGESDNGCLGAASSLSRAYLDVTNGTKYWFKLTNYSLNYGFPYLFQIKSVTTPENGQLPSIYPTRFKVGTATNADFDGAWGGYPAPTLARQWRRCDAAGANCTNISGATGASYTPVAGDSGYTIRLRVTATNTNGTTAAESLASDVVDNTPANDLWANRTNLGTASTVTLSDDNNWATSSESGEPTIGAFLARNTVWYRWTPAVGGDYVINNCLGGPATLDYLDLMIGIRTGTTSLATTAVEASGDDGCGPHHPYRTSMLFSATAGTAYSIEVASKSAGVTGPFSLSIAPVGDPVVTAQPTITGTSAPGGTLMLDPGDWISPSAISPVINWYSCDSLGANCVDTGLGGTAFNVLPAHAGKKLKAIVTLTNPYGSVAPEALSPTIALDSDGDGLLDGSDTCPTEAGNKPNGCPPSDIVGGGVPTITGNLVTGQAITSSNGSWSTTGDPLGYTLAHKWQRCETTAPASCADIPSATGDTYNVVVADLTKYLRVAVTASNADDTAVQYSAISVAVTAPPPPPANTVLPAVSGTLVVSQTLTTTDGSWTPGGVTFTREWLRCDDNASTGSCSVIAGQTGGTYALAAGDLSKYIRSRVTGTNPSGSTSATSNPTAVVIGDTDGDGVPDNTDACPSEAGARPNGCGPSDIVAAGVPTISGPLEVGQSLSSSQGSWTVLHDPLGYSVDFQWQRCDDATAGSCSDIPGETSSLYVLANADYGKRIRVITTATNADDSATQASVNSAAIDQAAGNTVPPALSGNTRVGQTLTTTNGTWVPIAATLVRSWHRCNDAASFGSCTTIAGQTGATYTLVAADEGKYIRSGVTGTTAPGSSFANSAASAMIITDGDADGVADGSDACPALAGARPNGCPPSDITAAGVPTLSGTFNVGQSIAATTGSWTLTGDPLGYTVAHQWQRCNDATVGSCSTIGGATGSSYVLVAADYGKRIRVNATASNADDSVTQSSAISAIVSQLPVSSGNPTLSGIPTRNKTLTATSQGVWTPADATKTNAWLRCTTASIGSCSTIAGETGGTYLLAAADVGRYMRIQVTATTAAGTAVATSGPTAPIAQDSDGDGVSDATDTCPAENGSKPNGCLPSDVVGAGIPTVSGTTNVGQTMNSTTGSWTVLHDPLGYTLSYQWQRCNDATVGSCSNIPAATSATYALTASEYGKRVRVNVTATNADDSALQSSALTGVISQLPLNSTPPGITGTAGVGQLLSADQGVWTPADTTVTYQWLRCDSTTIGDCTSVLGETGGTYTLTGADGGKYIRVEATGTTAAGASVAVSAPTVQVVTDTDGDGTPDATDVCPTEASARPNGCPLSDIVGAGVPTISGTTNVGQTLSATTGSWTVLHDPLGYALTYRWQRCDTSSAATCADISAATSATYVLAGADYGKRIRVNVTATNADDTALQSSAISAIVSQPPANLTLPTITGTARVGQTLTGAQGTWSPGDATLTNAWLRCTTTSVGSCTAIAGQTGGSYTLVAADDARYIRLQVTATTVAGTAVATSLGSAAVVTDADNDGVVDASDACPAEAGTKPNGCLPSDIVGNGVPTISGNLVVGQSVSSTTGSWTVLHDQLGHTVTHQWQRCDDATAGSCSDIGGATGSSYVLTASEQNKRVRAIATATNADDSATQASAITSPVIGAGSPPVNNTPPSISGGAVVGQTLTSTGTSADWTPADAALTYEWLRCTDTAEANCVVIAAASSSSYAPVAADVGHHIRARVTATSSALNTSVLTAPTAKVTAAPVAPPSGGGGSAPTLPAAPNPAKISGPASLKTVKASKKGGVSLSKASVYCAPAASGNCTGTVVLTGKIDGKNKTLAAGKLSTLPGGGRSIALKLSKSAMKALKTQQIKAQLTVTYTAPGFAPQSYIAKVTLKKP